VYFEVPSKLVNCILLVRSESHNTRFRVIAASVLCTPLFPTHPNPPTLQTDRQTDGQTDGRTTCNRNRPIAMACRKIIRFQLVIRNSIGYA